MSVALPSALPIRRQHVLLAGLLLLGLIGGVAAFPRDYLAATPVWVGICLFPFVLFVEGNARINYFYLIVFAVLLSLAYRYNIKIFYFLALACYLIFILEALVGRINPIVWFLVGAASPVFTQVSVILSFPIRLTLSEWACALLRIVGMDIHADGNMLMLRGYNFTVDEACMGLSMMAMALLMGVFIVSHHYKRTRKRLSFLYLMIFFGTLFCLNVITNLFRIVVLVLLQVPPENAMHEVIGIMCLILYTMIPLFFLARAMIRWKGTPVAADEKLIAPVTWRTAGLMAVMAVMLVGVGCIIDPVRVEQESEHAKVSIANMDAKELDGGITQFSNRELLVYVKPIPEFFTGEHTPLLCWRGSGYAFKQVKRERIAGQEIFMGTLVKGNSELYTAWWYTDGKIQTIDQLTWRTRMFTTGTDFCLVNVTASNRQILTQNLPELLSGKLLQLDPR